MAGPGALDLSFPKGGGLRLIPSADDAQLAPKELVVRQSQHLDLSRVASLCEIDVEILDPNGARTRLGGRARLRSSNENEVFAAMLRGGAARIGRWSGVNAAAMERSVVDVWMFDGETLVVPVRRSGLRWLARGRRQSGTPPLRILFSPGPEPTEDLSMVLVSPTRLVRVRRGPPMDSSEPWFARHGSNELRLAGAPSNWRIGYVVARSGRIAWFEKPRSVGPACATWGIERPRGALKPGSVVCGPREHLVLQVGLPHANGKLEWLVVDRLVTGTRSQVTWIAEMRPVAGFGYRLALAGRGKRWRIVYRLL
jgi:hypothetical protein